MPHKHPYNTLMEEAPAFWFIERWRGGGGRAREGHIVLSYRWQCGSAMMRGGTRACAIQLIGLGTSAICETVFQLYEQNTDVITYK